MKIVVKSSNDLKSSDAALSHCTCAGQPMATQAQLDCPWCGCGWMFSCLTCNKAFTYGEVAETDMTADQLGRALYGKDAEIDQEDIEGASEWLADELTPLSVGQIVVFLDGSIKPIDAPAEFDGWFARHSFARLPHMDAKVKADLDSVFGDVSYWRHRELPNKDGERPSEERP